MQPRVDTSSNYMPIHMSASLDSDDLTDDHERQAMLTGVSKVSSTSKQCTSPNLSLKWNILATWTIILCTILNLSLYVLTYPYAQPSSSSGHLRRPNQFIGLEKLPYNRSLLKEEQLTLTTYPTFIHQVDRSKPEEVVPSSGELVFTKFGTISPERRKFLVTEEISTVLQFRARDYGMEHCKLQLLIPSSKPPSTDSDAVNSEWDEQGLHLPAESGSAHAYEHMHDPDSSSSKHAWSLSGDTSDIEIWSLSAPRIASHWLSVSNLSYSTLSKRVERLGALRIRSGRTVSTHEFHCASDSILSFEVFCIGKGCRVEGWQGTGKPAVGMTLLQHSSL